MRRARIKLLVIIITSLIICTPYHSNTLQAVSVSEFLANWGVEIRILPDSPLYSVKLLGEQLRLFLKAPGSEARASLLLEFCNERLKEIYYTVNKENPSEIKLFNLLKRYEQQFEELQKTFKTIDVGSARLDKILEGHLTKKSILRDFVESKGESIDQFWLNEILITLHSSEHEINKLSHNTNATTSVLGISQNRGLELYPLEKKFELFEL